MNSRHAPDAKRNVALAAALLTLFALSATGQSARAELVTQLTNFQSIEAPQPSSGTFAIGVSGNTVVGGFYNPATACNGFTSTGSNFMPYNIPSSTTTVVSGISGSVKVGSYTDTVGSGTHGFKDDGSTVTTLNYQNNASIYTVATGVAGNNVVGYFNNGATHGFQYDGTTWTPIDEPTAGTQLTVAYGTDGSQIVGYFLAGGMLQGFWYDGSAYHTLDAPVPGVISTAAYGISGNDIVGAYQDSSGVYHGFLFDGSSTASRATRSSVSTSTAMESTTAFQPKSCPNPLPLSY
jgi:hypothetical protein